VNKGKKKGRDYETHLVPASSVTPSTKERSRREGRCFEASSIGYIEASVLWERRTAAMYWYNPTTRTSERVAAPSTDEEAIQVLAGDLDSAMFVSEYAEQRHLGMEIETALTMVGHQVRLRRHEYPPVRQPSHERPGRSRPRASGYELLLAVRLREVGGDREGVYRS
jgi:hypothetical protein